MRRIAVLLLILLTSIGCRTDQRHLLEAKGTHAVVHATPGSTTVGSFVTVTVEATLFRLNYGPADRVNTAEVTLGVCLVPDWSGQPDNCGGGSDGGPGPRSPSADFTMSSGDEPFVERAVTLGRGESITLTHEFSIAANRAGSVKLIGRLESSDSSEIPGGIACLGETCSEATWNE